MTDRRINNDKPILNSPNFVKTYVLLDPVQYGNEKVYQLEFRNLKTKDHLTVERDHKDAGVIEKTCAYLQLMTEQASFVIENLSHRDFLKVQEIVLDFLAESPETTAKM